MSIQEKNDPLWNDHTLYVGVNYHPHDWPAERWAQDVRLMKEAGFSLVRLGHLAWDSYEPRDGVYAFDWFDRVMDLFADAGIKVILDIAASPAPVWLFRKHPDISPRDGYGRPFASHRRYGEDIGHPDYRSHVVRYATALVSRYRTHPALSAFGLDNELGDGRRVFSESVRMRFIDWLRVKYGTVDALNAAWQSQRWSRRLSAFEDVELPVVPTWLQPEKYLDVERFRSDEVIGHLRVLYQTVKSLTPGVLTVSNYWPEHDECGFDYLKIHKEIIERTGSGCYPGERPQPGPGMSQQGFGARYRTGELDVPYWYVEFLSGANGSYGAPQGAVRMYAWLALLYGTQTILGWTWRTMLGGEEQTLVGLLDHDGEPNRKYHEYRQIADEFATLRSLGLPYRPRAEVAIAYSYDSFKASRYHTACFARTHRDQAAEAFGALAEENVDCCVIDLRNSQLPYKLVIVPQLCVMDQASADALRSYVQQGETVLMTAQSAMFDECNRAFGTTHPGRLSDVFGVRAGMLERAAVEYETVDGHARRIPPDSVNASIAYGGGRLPIDLRGYEAIEPRGADVVATLHYGEGTEVPIMTEQRFGAGRAIYLGMPVDSTLLRFILQRLCAELDISPAGPRTPENVFARRLSARHTLFVNCSGGPVTFPLERPGTGVLTKQSYDGEITLPLFGVEVVQTE